MLHRWVTTAAALIAIGAAGYFVGRSQRERFVPAPGYSRPGFVFDRRTAQVCWAGPSATSPQIVAASDVFAAYGGRAEPKAWPLCRDLR